MTAIAPASPGLGHLDADRAELVREVERRVMMALARAAARGGEAALEYVLNDAAYHEVRRLESGAATEREREQLPAWHDLARRLARMPEIEKMERLRALVRAHAEDVAGHFSPAIYRVLTRVLPGALGVLLSPQDWRRGAAASDELSKRFRVEGPLEMLRACAARGTLVIVPTHSSNLDSAVLGWSLHMADLPPMTYGAGKNLFANPIVGFFLRNLGAYRVDRRLKHELYKQVLKTYSTVLLLRGYHSLFFPGGTRSRSGAVESRLKLGLLGSALAAYQEHVENAAPHRRLYVVPATINYAIALEAESLIDDYLAEIGKQRYIIDDDESYRLRPAFYWLRRVLSLDGSLVIRYAAPLDPFGNAVDAQGESVDPRGRRVDPARYFAAPGAPVREDPQRDEQLTRDLGDELVRAYRRESVLMPTQIVARVVFDRCAAAEGTRDVYRLLRAQNHASFPLELVLREIARWTRADPAAVLDDALRAFAAFHTAPALERQGDRVMVRHMRLLYYYQNRTAHLEGPP